ncbi:MAG: hypothetical protein ACOY3P_20060 [Planctomycetota bacterium]
MLRHDTLELIQQTAVRAERPQIIDYGDPRRRLVLLPSGEVREVCVQPQIRHHETSDMESLVSFALRAAAEGSTPSIWIDTFRIKCLADDNDRRDWAVTGLLLSRQFKMLQRLSDERTLFSQTEFLRTMRLELGLPKQMLAPFLRMEWSAGSTTTGTVGHGSDRMGKSIAAEVKGADGLPEDLQFTVPVYTHAWMPDEFPIRCAVDLREDVMKISLIPLPGELDLILFASQNAIRKQIEDMLNNDEHGSKVLLYHGQP